MNNHMYEHPATHANVATLRERGVTVLEPGTGRLASKGEEGAGASPSPRSCWPRASARLARFLEEDDRVGRGDAAGVGFAWRGVRVLVTAGGTREPIDSVRFVGNSSSGGWASRWPRRRTRAAPR